MPFLSTVSWKKDRRGHKRLVRDVRIIVEPGRIVPIEEFYGDGFPEYSVALDGYVAAPPSESPDGRKRVLNHHEGVMRLATRSTASQACMLVGSGRLVESFTVDGVYTINIYMQDPDQDNFWASYILKYPEDIHRPMFHQFLHMADVLDTTSGLYPVNLQSQLLKRLMWISSPYTLSRAAGRLSPKRPYEERKAEMLAIIDACHRRIRATFRGHGKKLDPDVSFEVLRDYGTWQFIREIGTEARLGVGASGIPAFVTFVGEQPVGGPYHYAVHRRSPQERDFPEEDIIRDLNIAEGREPEDPKGWGCGDVCGGSPRSVGSPLTWEQVCDVVDGRVKRGPRSAAEVAAIKAKTKRSSKPAAKACPCKRRVAKKK